MKENMTPLPAQQLGFASRYILTRLFRKAEDVLDQMQASQKEEADALRARAEKAEAKTKELEAELAKLRPPETVAKEGL